MTEAKTQIETVYADTSLYDVTRGDPDCGYVYDKIMYRPTGQQIRVSLHSENVMLNCDAHVEIIFWELGIVTETRIIRPTIADLETFLGDPELVRLATGVELERITLLYQNTLVHAYVDELECDKVLPDQEVLSVILRDAPQGYGGWLSEPHEWIGYDYCYNFERMLF